MMRRLLTLTATAGLLLTAAVGTPTAAAHSRPYAHPVSVVGTVADPASYSPAELAASPQVTLPDLRLPRRAGRVLSGTSLEALVAASSPTLPAVKNAQLRVTLTVTGHGHDAVAVALGELTATGGDHPGLLITRRHGRHGTASVDLVFPGDLGRGRTVRDVRQIRVGVVSPALPTDLPAGSVLVTTGRRSVTLSAAELRGLPVTSRTVQFLSGQGPQTHLEAGPTLAAVLDAARIRTTPTTTMAATAGDGYVATVTPAEATSGRRVLLLATSEDGISLGQPRLVTDGDVYGGRYVTGVLALDVRSARGHR